MAFTPINLNTIKVGDPITRDRMVEVKDNFDDHESRINQLETSGGQIILFNDLVSFVGFNINSPYVFYYKATQNFSVSDFKIQIISKQGIVAGNLTFELEKSNDTNNANFTSILTTATSFNFSSDSDYSVKSGSINSGVNNITTGQVIRCRVTNCPTNAFGYNWSDFVVLSVGAS